MVGLAGAARPASAALQIAADLHLGNHLQGGVQPLVLDDRRTVNRAQLIEGSVGQGHTLMHDIEAAIRIVADDHLLAGKLLRQFGRVENEHHLVVTQRQSLRQRADLLAAQRPVQVLVIGEGTVHVLRVAWLLGKARIEVRHSAA